MKSAALDPAELDTILPGDGSSLPPARTTSLPRMIRDYLGFESAAGDEPRSGRSAVGAGVRPRSRTGPDLLGGDYNLGSIRRAGVAAADTETVWPDAHFAPRAATRSVPRPQAAPADRPDLQAAATVYLRAQARTDGADHAATVAPGDVIALNPLFAELHRSSPADARRLAEGLTSLPGPGDSFLGFHIVEELGRGAFGRVFLARQGDLAGRMVALKVSAELPGESRTLAQLQHTNIVPIFSAHESPPLHAVCMPYFGRATLADLLEGVEGQASLPASGRELVKVVNSRRVERLPRVAARVGGGRRAAAERPRPPPAAGRPGRRRGGGRLGDPPADRPGCRTWTRCCGWARGSPTAWRTPTRAASCTAT